MDDRRASDLEAMDERQATRLLTGLASDVSSEAELVRGGLWVVGSVVDYGGGRVLNGAAILELKDGKVWRDTRYFAEPFEAPGWRTRWVERM